MLKRALRTNWAVVPLILGALIIANFNLAQAGIYNAGTEVTYKEYWIPHSEFTGGCGEHEKAYNWYVEPWGCDKTMTFNLPDDFSQALKVEIYLDLWRNYNTPSARFRLNDGPTHAPNVGSNWSRTPYIAEIPKSELRQGSNTITIWQAGAAFHLHDAAFRIYYDQDHPLLPGPNSDVTPPNGNLTLISAANGDFAPDSGGVLDVNNHQITLSADATDAAYVEFHAFYQGYDEDNDGQKLDWHNLGRNNFHPGGTEAQPSGGTIDHIGADSSAPYQVTWDLRPIINQAGVKFKLRLVDAAGNVREAAGGASAAFTLARTYRVEAYTIPNFKDFGLHMDGKKPDTVSYAMNLPSDLSTLQAAYLLGNYWKNPSISLNDQATFRPFSSGQDQWALSMVSLNRSHLLGGSNTIRYSYAGGFGHFIEKPGPMVVLHFSEAPPPTATLEHPFLVSSTSNGNAKGLAFRDEDIVLYDSVTGAWSMFFDGSDVGVTTDVNGFTILDDGSLLLTFNVPTSIAGFGTVDDSDIIRFVPTAYGANTTGSFEWHLLGADVNLTTNGEDIDSIGFAPDGRLLISTLGAFNVPGVKGPDEDLIAFQSTTPGDNSSGNWSLYFDGSAVGLSDASEDVGAAWLDPASSELYLATAGAYAVSDDVAGNADDIFVCSPNAGAPITACSFRSFLDGAAIGFGDEVIDGLFVITGDLPLAISAAGQFDAEATMDSPDDPADAQYDDVDPSLEELEDDDGLFFGSLYLPLVGNAGD